MSQYVTISKSSENFRPHLDGSFSKDLRAIPQKSLNVNSLREQVTFKIVQASDIHKPNALVLLFKLFRFDWLSLSLGPSLATYSYLSFLGQEVNHAYALLAVLTVCLLHAAVFALNDYRDHIKGVDRMSFLGGSQVIQKGWVRAKTVRDMGVSLFVIGSAIGLYFIFKQPFYLVAVGLFTLISVLGYSFFGQGLKYLGLGELVSFLCFGPLLSYGFARASVEYHDWKILLLGLPFGFLAAVCFQSRHLANIMSDNHFGIKSLPIRFGFDRFKKFLQFQLMINPMLLAVCLYLLDLSWLSYLFLVPYAFFSVKLALGISDIQSSLSVQLENLKNRSCDLHIFLSTILIIVFWLSPI